MFFLVFHFSVYRKYIFNIAESKSNYYSRNVIFITIKMKVIKIWTRQFTYVNAYICTYMRERERKRKKEIIYFYHTCGFINITLYGILFIPSFAVYSYTKARLHNVFEELTLHQFKYDITLDTIGQSVRVSFCQLSKSSRESLLGMLRWLPCHRSESLLLGFWSFGNRK